MSPTPNNGNNGHQHRLRNGRWLFASNFFKHPTMLGSIIPSSRFLVDRLLGPVDWSRARVVVEYGPGVGTVTRALLKRMPADGRLLAIELNADFADYLRREIRDPRLTVVQGSAADLGDELDRLGWPAADYAVSGIPFSTMPEDIRDSILRVTLEHLRPDGEFLVFQFSDRVRRHLERTFPEVKREFELLNFLPAHCYRCRRDGLGAAG